MVRTEYLGDENGVHGMGRQHSSSGVSVGHLGLCGGRVKGRHWDGCNAVLNSKVPRDSLVKDLGCGVQGPGFRGPVYG